MAELVNVWCDQGQHEIVATVQITSTGAEISQDFYRIFDNDGNATSWHEFALNDDEINVCRGCMLKRTSFRERYPWLKK